MATKSDNSGVWASIASTFGDMIGGGLGFGLNWITNQDNRDWSEQQYLKYQSPQALMRQMEYAGINPNLAAQGLSGSPQSLMNTASGGFAPNFSDMGSNALNSYYMPKLVESEVKNRNADTSVKETVAEGNNITNKFNKETFDTRKQKLIDEGRMTQYQADQLRPYAEHAEEWYKINFDNLDEKANLLRKQQDKIDEEIKNLSKQRDLMVTQMGLNGAMAWEARERARLTQQKNMLFEELGADNVETAYVRALVNGETDKANALKDGVTTYVKEEEKAQEEGRQTAINENDPERMNEKDLTDKYLAEKKKLDSEIAETEQAIDDYWSGKRKDNWFNTRRSQEEEHLKRLKARRENLINEYNENLRRRKTNESTSVSTSGVSQSK